MLLVGILNDTERAGNLCEVCKRHNVTETTIYRWSSKFGGMDVSEARG